MAEARAMANTMGFGATNRAVALSYTEKGFHFDFRITIPTPSEALRLTKLRFRRASNWFRNSLFPFGPLAALAVMMVGIFIVVYAPPDSWFRTGWLAQLVWSISLWFPWYSGLPHMARLGLLAAWTSLVIVFLVALLQRGLIRLMLRSKMYLYQARKPSLLLKIWFVVMKILIPRGNPLLYSFQGVLPRLPVPPLKQTVQRYLASVEALQTPEEFKATKASAEEFLNTVGNSLQRYCVLKSWYAPNYVTDWWEKYVYLMGRDPIVINSNYYVLDAARYCPSEVQEARLAAVLYNMCDYQTKLENETLKPTTMHGVIPLCMDQFRRLFGTTRVPGRECDEIQTRRSRHAAVLCNGSYYYLPLRRKNGGPVMPHEFERQFREIKADALSRTPDEAEANIAALTGENRTKWAEARERFFAEGMNKRTLDLVEKAALFIHLEVEGETDDYESWTGRGRSLMHGNGGTRWFDKSLTLVAFPNGRVGMNAEHSFADAPVVAHLFECAMIVAEKYQDWYLEDGTCKIVNPAAGCSRDPLRQWHRMVWSLPRACEEVVLAARNSVRTLIDDLELSVVSYDKYGKGFMKQCRVSPDAYIQMAMQLAYFRDIGRSHVTYEASMTRLFLKGRTETVRSVSTASAHFVKTMLDDKATPQDKLQALQDAAVVHQKAYMDAMSGNGIDRHLFALYIVSKGMGVESPFLQAALREPWRLSTSQQPQTQTGLWDPRNPDDLKRVSPGGGFGPVTDDGYGVSYMVASETELFFHVSSKKSSPTTSTERFIGNLFSSLDMMKDILSLAHQKKQA